MCGMVGTILAWDSKYCVVGEAWIYGKAEWILYLSIDSNFGLWTCIKYGQK